MSAARITLHPDPASKRLEPLWLLTVHFGGWGRRVRLACSTTVGLDKAQQAAERQLGLDAVAWEQTAPRTVTAVVNVDPAQIKEVP